MEHESDGGKIKPAHFKHEYTKKQALEILKCANDPVYFIENYVKLKHPKHGAMAFKLYDFQKRLIRTYQASRRSIAMLSRQCGKTQTASAYILWWAIFKSDQVILIVSKDQGGADEIMERLWFSYEELPWWIKPGVKVDSVRTKEFDNGTRILSKATTESSGRGLSVSLLYMDEFAFVRPRIAKEFWASISPTLATGGDCIITSTPNTDEDKFSEIWFNARHSRLSDPWEDQLAKRYGELVDESEDKYETIFETDEIQDSYELNLLQSAQGDDDDEDEEQLGFTRFHANWRSVPELISADGRVLRYRGDKFKRGELKNMSLETWLREYECSFTGGDSTLISSARMAEFRSTVRAPRFVDKFGTRWYENILPNMAYAVAMDPSGDGQGDDAAIQVWEVPTMRQVAEWNSAEPDQDEQARMLRRILTRLYLMQQNLATHNGSVDIYYSVERNAVGIGIIRAIEAIGEENFPGYFIDATEISTSVRGESSGSSGISRYRGMITTNGTKKRYAQVLKQYIERHLFVVRSKILSSQLKTFVRTGPSWAARDGSKDDVVMSAVLMCQLIDEIRYMEPELDEYVRPDFEELEEQEQMAEMPMLPVL